MSFWIKNGFILSLDKLVLYLNYVGPALGVLLVYKLSKMKNIWLTNVRFFIIESLYTSKIPKAGPA